MEVGLLPQGLPGRQLLESLVSWTVANWKSCMGHLPEIIGANVSTLG